MVTKEIPWCCDGYRSAFKVNFERQEIDGVFTDRRGYFVTCRLEQHGHKLDEPFFVLVSRAVAKENVSKLPVTPVPISLETEIGMRFCPWCGVNLAERYARHLDLLAEDSGGG